MCLVLAACVGPETLTIQPLLNLPPQDIGRGRTIALEVIDARPNKTLGGRRTVFPEAIYPIVPSGDIKIPVRNALATALFNYQFVVTQSEASMPLAMTATIEDIRYTDSGLPLFNNVRADIAMKVVCRNGAREYTSRYTSYTSRRLSTTPSAQDNEEMINTLLSRVLERMMSDPALLTFLKS